MNRNFPIHCLKITLILLLLAQTLLHASPASGSSAALQTSNCTQPTYLVQPGDTLGLISVRCDITYTVLLGINWQLNDPNKIWPGQVIRLKAESTLPTEQQPVEQGTPRLPGLQPDGSYIVRAGDSLARIAFLFQVTLRDLQDVNPQIGENTIIRPGERLILPPAAQGISGGFVGVPDTEVTRAQKVVVEVHYFPPFTPIDVRLKNLDGTSVKIYDGETDALGSAFVTVTIPSTARTGDIWVVEVVTTELEEIFQATSTGMVIQ